MTTQTETTLPRDISAVAYKNPFPIARMARASSSAANASTTTPVIGQRMPDGTVYAGISPDTGRPMFTTPKDTGLCADWYKAMDHATKLDAHGHTDWRVPTTRELNELFTHRAAVGNFNETGSLPAGWYRSSSQSLKYSAWLQRFSDGRRDDFLKDHAFSLRCVRG